MSVISRLEDAISITPYMRSKAEDVRGGQALAFTASGGRYLGFQLHVLPCKILYTLLAKVMKLMTTGISRSGQLVTKVASSRRLMGVLHNTPHILR